MHKVLFIVILLLLSNCQRKQVVKTHGVVFLDKKQKSLIVNESNKNDIKKILGYPSTVGTFDDSTWIYIERTRTRGKLLKFGQNITYKNNVLELKFNEYGILSGKKFYNKNRVNNIEFTKKETDTIVKDKNFVYSFLSSIRQKINAPVKRKKD